MRFWWVVYDENLDRSLTKAFIFASKSFGGNWNVTDNGRGGGLFRT